MEKSQNKEYKAAGNIFYMKWCCLKFWSIFLFPEPVVGQHVSLRNLVTQRAVRSIQQVLRTSYPPICQAVPFNTISEVKSRKLLGSFMYNKRLILDVQPFTRDAVIYTHRTGKH